MSRKRGTVEYGIGSARAAEYDECLLNARIVTESTGIFTARDTAMGTGGGLFPRRGTFAPSRGIGGVFRLRADDSLALACGLLPGVCRAWLLARGEIEVRRINAGDLRRASPIGVVNSVRKWRDAMFVEHDDQAKMVGPEGLEPSTKGL